jgi:hypothetical protein
MTHEEALEELKGLRKPIIDLFATALSGETGHLYDYDLYAAGAVNRAIAIINSFCLLLPEEPLGAIALIRIHLDTLLRVNATALVDNRLTFVREVMGGARLDKMKLHPDIVTKLSLTNDRMTDRNLVAVLGSLGNNVESIYNDYCEDIHLSGKTLEMAVQEKTEGIHFSIGTNDFISEDQKMKAVSDMIYITMMFIASLQAYLAHKSSLSSEASTEAVDLENNDTL